MTDGTEHPSNGTGGSGAHLPLPEDLQKVMGAVQDWVRRTLTEAPATPVECHQWCPICQFANVLRGEHPEIGEKLAEAGTALAAAVRALADATAARARDAAGGDGGDGETRDRPRPTPRVQRIPLDDPPGT